MNLQAALGNFIYAVLGGVMTIVFMVIGYKVMDLMTPFSTAEELKKGNRAVGSVVQGTLMAVGIAVGLVIGLGLN